MDGLGADRRVPELGETGLVLDGLTSLCGSGLHPPLCESNIGVELLAEDWLAESIGGAEAEARGHVD